MSKENDIITATSVMKATIGGENLKEINEEIEKINEGKGSISPSDMREYLLKEPPADFILAEKLRLEERDKVHDYDDDDDDGLINEEQETDILEGPLDPYNEYARQFGGLLITFMEKNPDLAKSNDWLAVANKEQISSDEMNDWLTVLSAKWAEGMARYALNKPYHNMVVK